MHIYPLYVTLKISIRAHQTRRSGPNSRPISAEVALPRLKSEIKVAFFLFASHSFLAYNFRFMVKLIDKAVVIHLKIHKNERKMLYSSKDLYSRKDMNLGRFNIDCM
jgi:hypothetical protein